MKTQPAIGRSAARCQQRGAGLVEVLVAFLLISLATLGVVRLTANNIGIDKGTQLRLTALSLANQYAERERAPCSAASLCQPTSVQAAGWVPSR